MDQDRLETGPPRDHGCWYDEFIFSFDDILSLSSTHSQGIKAVIAESYERIHRSNLVGMGVVPLQFLAGETPGTLGLTGQESYTITLSAELTPAWDAG